MRILSILVLLLALTMFFACSDDGSNPFGDPPIDDSDRPTIPEPTSYNGSVPTVSERLIVELVLLSNFSAAVDSAIPWGCGPPYMDYPCTMFPINTETPTRPEYLSFSTTRL